MLKLLYSLHYHVCRLLYTRSRFKDQVHQHRGFSTNNPKCINYKRKAVSQLSYLEHCDETAHTILRV